MKNQMKMWQLVMGCVLCLGIISSVFMSRITVTSGRMVDCTMNILEDAIDQYKKTAKDDELVENIEGYLKDQKADMKENAEKQLGNQKITRSSLQLIFASKGGVEKFLRDLTGKEDFDGEDEKELVDKLHGALLLPRIMLVAIYILPILLIAVYIVIYLKRWRNLLAIISTWVYFLLAAVSNLAWYLLLPSVGGKRLANAVGDSAADGLGFGYSLVKGSVEDMMSSAMRHMLTAFTGLGIWVFTIGSILLLVYSFLLLLFRGAASASDMWAEGSGIGVPDGLGTAWDESWNQGQYHAGGIGNAPAGNGYQDIPIMQDMGQQDSNYSNMVTQYGGEPYPAPAPSGMAGRQGKIRITRGTMAGAEIACKPGEQIVVGRDPSVSDLVLSHRKVSRKHFVICYTEEADQFEIFCFSENGIQLSNGGRIGKDQHASLARGMAISIADGEEAMILE